MDIAHLQTWIGRSEEVAERVGPFASNALGATLDRDEPPYTDGGELPLLWHWLHFHTPCPQGQLGPDGHPARGGFIPPIPLPRRMWAGSRLTSLAPMRIGRQLRRVSTIKDVAHKSGRSGELVFVTVRHRILDGDTPCVEEEQDIVYREAPAAGAPVPTPKSAPEGSAFSRAIDPDPVLLQRYSALTFNGHRIHYDRDFCKQDEGYPGLVVHGPLLATLLLDLLRRQYPGARIADFSFRAVAPVFDINDFSVHGAPDKAERTFRLWVRRHDGALAMTAIATLAEG
ncbi:FAS1-like dehydratase domain-containing protein [Thalassovita aquimarina]|uniref:FAS1-like dehydratase domain-containing protein n=1 Tax=Thalassovita aquimarina TaxID=2785917 RepID=UPI0031BB7E15